MACPCEQPYGIGALAAHLQRAATGRDDLGRAAMVDREPHDLDAGQVTVDVDQQHGVGAVEPVDRLGRIAHQVEIAAPAGDQPEQPAASSVTMVSRSSRSTTPRRRFSSS